MHRIVVAVVLLVCAIAARSSAQEGCCPCTSNPPGPVALFCTLIPDRPGAVEMFEQQCDARGGLPGPCLAVLPGTDCTVALKSKGITCPTLPAPAVAPIPLAVLGVAL